MILMIDRGKGIVFFKLGKIFLVIIYLVFFIILLFRRVCFLMLLRRVSEYFIYMIRIGKGILVRVFGI